MKTKIFILSFLLIATTLFSQAPKWSLELDDPIEGYSFLDDGNYLFFRIAEDVFLYNAFTGQKIYSLSVDGYDKDAVHQLVGEKYLVSSNDNLRCYDALTGKLIWEKEYKDISQDKFTQLRFVENICVLRYGLNHVAIDITNGNEFWRQRLSYNDDVVKKGGWNFLSLDKQKKLLVLLDADALGLYKYSDGKETLYQKDIEIDGDLVENGQQWYYISPDQRYIVFTLDGAVSIIDVQNDKEIFRTKTTFDEEKGAIFETEVGCAILGEDAAVFFNTETGKAVEVNASINDFRTFELMKVGDKEILFAGMKNEMFAVDVSNGKVLWRSQKNDPNFEGYAHRYIKIDGENLIVTYTITAASVGGVNVYLMSINALTGKVNYKTPPLSNSPYGTADWARTIFRGVSKFMGAKEIRKSLGYDNIGYNYSIEEFDGNLVFGVLSINPMQNPETMKSGGDGIVIINPKTGEILFKDYLRLSDYSLMSIGAIRYSDMMPYINGHIAYLVGNENIAAYDLKQKKQLWLNKETLKGIPREAIVIDGVLYIKFGEFRFNVSVEPPKLPPFDSPSMKVEKKWDEDPYGFAAYDAKTGNLLWRIETEVDPSFLTPNFSFKDNYDPATKRLYFGDEENIYALQLKRDGGKYDYVINFGKNNLGGIQFEKTYTITEWKIGTISISFSGDYMIKTTRIGGSEYYKFLSAAEEADATTDYEAWFSVWGVAAKKCLRVVYDNNAIFAMAQDGIAIFNAADGKPIWTHKWEYDQDNVQYSPIIIGDKLIYCVERMFTNLDLKTGKTIWQSKENKRPIFLLSPNEKFIYTINQDLIRGYEL
ncbi:MAG: PQQ-binding-like beta-propeller repeat protein [Melioribacteraceae bacterium]|nr:PQQ-binding-like beta-propeller repeat protein [Melioribacteraceae bacterium]